MYGLGLRLYGFVLAFDTGCTTSVRPLDAVRPMEAMLYARIPDQEDFCSVTTCPQQAGTDQGDNTPYHPGQTARCGLTDGGYALCKKP